ncbi:hypothetical protein QAD02_023216 [Eretmocerus hayati]|uniref:Uncharacterized protein n=1 Tax=Eretmocerus hayati TaxID=131215 RepID=A0ACC2PVK5_9HYME|nr:hypothetical protein QAD02_023216 [Eretmocerus hayati]
MSELIMSINTCVSATGINFVTRFEWQASLPVEARTELDEIPPPYVIIIHTVTEFCITILECIENVQGIQDYHMRGLNYNDIGYNFLIGGDGSVFVGLGWNIQGAHTLGYNRNSLGIAFIGNFMHDNATSNQIQAAEKLLKFSVKDHKLAENYKLMGQRQVSANLSPGENLYKVIKGWDHWTPVP